MLNRRTVLQSMASTLPLLSVKTAPAIISPESVRPQSLWGSMIGEVSRRQAIFWSRVDRPAELHLEWSLDPDFRQVNAAPTAKALPDLDYTVRVVLRDLPAGRRIFYRAHFESLLHRGARSRPLYGEFSVASSDPSEPCSFAWSGDTFGQGYGINPLDGGVKIYDAIAARTPNFFIHCGDRIYADQPLKSQKSGGKGRRWVNLLTPEIEKVAQELDDFRGHFRYAFLDETTRRFHQIVPQVFLWDDHEVKNDWWPGKKISDRRYKVRDCSILAQRSRQAFFEYSPFAPSWMEKQSINRVITCGPHVDLFILDSRSDRGPNYREHHTESSLSSTARYFGPSQLHWLQRSISQSTALWKVIVTPQPLGLVIGSGSRDFDGISSGFKQPLGRELELSNLLHWLHDRKIQNTVWLSADVHYAAAHHFHPSRGHADTFFPFWEFVAGPMNAATLRPHRLDPTFGPERIFCSSPEGMKGSLSPLDDQQFFGMCELEPIDRTLKVSLHDRVGHEIFATTLTPSRA